MASQNNALKILVVDDSKLAVSAVTNHLKALGYSNFDTAENGKVAMQKVGASLKAGQPYNLLLLDWNMPEMTGFEVVQAVKALPGMEKAYLAMLTAENDPDLVQKVREIGADIIINKPFNQDKIKILLKKLEEKGLGKI